MDLGHVGARGVGLCSVLRCAALRCATLRRDTLRRDTLRRDTLRRATLRCVVTFEHLGSRSQASQQSTLLAMGSPPGRACAGPSCPPA